MNFLTLVCFLSTLYSSLTAIMSDGCFLYSDIPNQNCIKCKAGYTLSFGSCQLCAGQCRINNSEEKVDQSGLQNCKEIDRNGKCVLCFPGYNIDINNNCVKVDDSALRENCLVFMQKNSQCVLCEDGYAKQNNNGPCKVVRIQIGSNGVIGLLVKPSNTLAQAQKISTLVSSLIQQNNVPKNTSQLASNTSQQIPLKPIDRSNGKIVISQQGNNITKIKLDFCDEYETKKNQKLCLRCVKGYFLNPLARTCASLSSPILISSTKKNLDGITSKFVKNDTNINNNILSNVETNTSVSNKSENSSNSRVESQTNQNTTKTEIKSNISSQVPELAKQLSNSSNVSQPKAIRNISAEVNSSSDINSAKNNTSITNSSNLVAVNNATAINNGSTTGPLENKNASTNISSLPNVTKISNASQSAGYTTIIIPNAKNIINDEKPPEVLKIAITSTESPNPINFCVRYRVVNNECIQCENKYNLYQNKCLGAFQYKQAMKNSTSGTVYNIIINTQAKTSGP